MAVVTTSVVISDSPTETVFEDTHKESGKTIATAIRVVPKTGSAAFNEADVRVKARQALSLNATYLALATPTAAQNTAQVKRLTRECNGLIRLLLGELQDVSDT